MNMEELEISAAGVRGAQWRITLLTDRLVRLEWQDAALFVDGPTQLVVCRDFPAPTFRVETRADQLRIITDYLEINYDGREFSGAGLTIRLRHAAGALHGSTWHYGQALPVDQWHSNLGGTVRTLDMVDGEIPLDPGLVGRAGVGLVDDSASLLLGADGWPHPRRGPGQDLYFFGYGLDYEGALRDFFRLTGPSPLVPRYTLGNWWSRYWAYSAAEYQALLDDFAARQVPLSVAVLDMDWHLTDIDPTLGTGWTGYTWNRDLYPDPPAFLTALHGRGLAVCLNVHPADGIRRHETAYPQVAAKLGVENGDTVPFDIADRDFVASYFADVHRPLEDEGVDFWWLDWQQGTHSRLPGLDPLWMLNHLHYRDSQRRGRGLIFSRYAGLGSHRYPLGFSGDTIITWQSLAFQPYFTATAANVGYFWWSHDIGGHMFGRRSAQLQTRWLQLGVFSPVNRLHSTSSPFAAKMPWVFPAPHQEIQERFLRLRHRLIPYLYTLMWHAHTDGRAPIAPVYHRWASRDDAYAHRNNYLFGQLLVAPLTQPVDPVTCLAGQEAWLPPGTWFDIFTGERYVGDRHLMLYRPLEHYPVLAPAGTILPLASEPSAATHAHPAALTLRLFPGVGRFQLVEDDGGADPVAVTIDFTWRWEDTTATLTASGGDRRTLTLELVGATGGRATSAAGSRRGQPVIDELLAPACRFDLGQVNLANFTVRLTEVAWQPTDWRAAAFALLEAAEIALTSKERAWAAVQQLSGAPLVAALAALSLPPSLHGALTELIANHA